MRAGFAEIDITPPSGTQMMGWLRRCVSTGALDPLYARLAVFESGEDRLAFLQLDTLSIRWTQVYDIRRRVEAQYGFPGTAIMVSATHNHAGPAIANLGESERDDTCIETVTQQCVTAFGNALQQARTAQVGLGSCFNFDIAQNRRVVMRDGTACTHGTFRHPDALCLEGPIDPEVAVLAARDMDGTLLGAIVNYACHPCHHGDGTLFSAGYPGVLAAVMKERGCPVTLFLNGAYGNMHTSDPRGVFGLRTKEEVGIRLADDAMGVITTMSFRDVVTLTAHQRTVQLPYRDYTDAEVAGTLHGAQRFVDPTIYDRGMPALLERIRTRGTQPAEVQVLSIDEYAFAGIPAEYFVEHQLRIKEACHPRHALVVGGANGMVGYVPTRAAFARGGYETTFAGSSRQAAHAGDLLAECVIAQIRAGG